MTEQNRLSGSATDERRKGAAFVSGTAAQNNRKKILIVDDSEINRSLLSDMLSDEYDIVEAENGMEAAGILRGQEHAFAVMLLDIVMPVMDGFEVLAMMNKNGWIKSVPVIVISAETVPSIMDRAYDLGALDYISRPFDERIVRRRVMSTIMLSAKQKELTQMLADQVYEKEKDNRLMIEILSNIVEFRNGESGLHVLHIYTLTDLLLRRLLEKTDRYDISKKNIPLICNASALHDIGKIAVPEHILNKPGRLTKEEFEVMKTHSAEGAKLLQMIPMRQQEPLIRYGYQICRWHHERYDGRGYPDGLAGEDIPIAAQVVSLADVYDALTSKRVYKEAYSHERAIQMILNGECGAFNPLLLECLMDVSDVLKKEMTMMSLTSNSNHQLINTVDMMLERGDLDISERTLRLLEHERTKSQFYADMSQEIQFEYTEVPEMLILSEWGARYLDMPETIINPRASAFAKGVFAAGDFDRLLEKLKGTTPAAPVIEENYLLTIHGHERWSKVITRSMWNDGETPEYTGFIGKIVDIHEQREKMDRLEMVAAHDSLTGLLNHKTFKQRVSELIDFEGEKKYILVFFDLDNFKQANDTYGHLFGDEVLKCVADILRHSTRSSDILARMGGDEFLLFMEYKTTIEPQVKRIFTALTTAVYQDFKISVSMGVARVGTSRDYDEIFHKADEASYEAKRSGKGSYCIYDQIEKGC